MRILLTGFEPFGGDTSNASSDVLPLVEDRWDGGAAELVTAVLPVTFSGVRTELAARASEVDAIVCLGEAGGRTAVTPERWAHVIADARIADNEGVQPRHQRLDDGAERLPSSFDPAALTAAILDVGVPAETSDDAGRFVCNATFRAALGLGPATFIHVPALRPGDELATVGEETDGAALAASQLTLEQVADAIVAALVAIVEQSVH